MASIYQYVYAMYRTCSCIAAASILIQKVLVLILHWVFLTAEEHRMLRDVCDAW